MMYFNCSTFALSRSTSEATVALRALFLNFLFLTLMKGPEVKAEMSRHLLVCSERQRLLCIPCSGRTQECIQRNAPEIFKFGTSQPNRSISLLEASVHVH